MTLTNRFGNLVLTLTARALFGVRLRDRAPADGRLVAGAPYNYWTFGAQKVHLLEVETARPSFPPAAIPKYIHGLALSPDGRTLAVARIGGTDLLDPGTGAVRLTLADQSCAAGLAFSADGKQIISVEGWRPWLVIKDAAELRIQDIPTGQQKASFKVPNYMAGEVLFSPDARYFTGFNLANLTVFRVADGKEIFSLKDQVGVTFSADSQRLFTLGKNGTVLETAFTHHKNFPSFKVPIKGELARCRLAVHPKGQYLAVAATSVNQRSLTSRRAP